MFGDVNCWNTNLYQNLYATGPGQEFLYFFRFQDTFCAKSVINLKEYHYVHKKYHKTKKKVWGGNNGNYPLVDVTGDVRKLL